MFLKAKRSFGTVALMALSILALLFSTGGTGTKTAMAESDDEAQAAATQGQHATWMTIRINGQVIEGDTTRENRKGQIELLAFEQSVTTAREAGSGLATGRRQYQPLLIRKRIDKASPLLMKALTENSNAEVRFDFYRGNPTGDGTEERFYEISLRNARVASAKIVMDRDTGEPMEEITFVFGTIQWTYTNGGVTHEDSWSQQR
jgi:type VI secretion system secreted protein Hcp